MESKDLLSLPKDDFMRAKIIASIWALLRNTSFQKLSVTNVCKHAGIACSSFYNLFIDLSDALSWENSRIFSMIFEKYPFCTDWRADLAKQLTAYMDRCLKDAVVFKKMAMGMDLVDPSAIFWRTRAIRVRSFLDTIELWQGKPADERAVFEIEFFVCGESHAVANWIRSMKEAPKIVAENIVGCIPERLGQLMDSSFAAYQARQAPAR